MTDLRCKCGAKLAEYSDNEVRIMDRKCKTVTVLKVIDGKIRRCDGRKHVVNTSIWPGWTVTKFSDGTETCELNKH
jgi:hypothetical protein